MPSLEEQFETAFTEIMLGDTGKHLLEAEAVTECLVNNDHVTVVLDLPQDEGLRKTITAAVEGRIGQIAGIGQVTVRMSDAPAPPPPQSEARQPQRPERVTYLQNYQHIIAVGSGKGGVGKSTVAVNLAIALQQLGHRVSLFDADIYGPSVPIMMGLRNMKPDINPQNHIVPLEKHGLEMMSIGNLVDEAAATVWRGPIVHQVIEQLLRDTRWSGGDFMIIDLPPGTGDAHLTLTQLLELSGVVIVSTPQDVALLDALKAITMFQKVEVPILGLVENMSSFFCPKCGTETPIFDKGNAERAGNQHNAPFLGRIPIETGIREGGDNGIPVTYGSPDSASARSFKAIAQQLVDQLGMDM